MLSLTQHLSFSAKDVLVVRLYISWVKLWRVVGFDDGFESFKSEKAYLVGCVTSGSYVEGFLIDLIDVDGWDVTEKIISLIKDSRFRIQLKCVMLSGLTFAGFNVADVKAIHESTSIPVVVVMERKPNFERIKRALSKLDGFEKRLELIRKAGEIHRIGKLYVQIVGCDLNFAKNVLKLTTVKGKIPEPLRIAHLVASALIHRESKRR